MFTIRLFGGPHGPRRDDSGRPLRVLIVSTPRAGNTWLRHQLNKIYSFSAQPNGELPRHTVEAVPWGELPARCIVQLHWHHVEPLTSLLREHQFRVVTLARHPLAVLISVLQYRQHIEVTGRWLSGEGGDESTLPGATPCSAAFLKYATSPRAAALLSVSPEWWTVPGSLRLRYEDLVRDTPGTLGRLTRSLGRAPTGRIAEAVAACTIDRLRNPENAPHFWQGSPDLWRSLLTAEACRRVQEAHPAVFRTLGYRCDADPSLTADQADANWCRLAGVGSSRLREPA